MAAEEFSEHIKHVFTSWNSLLFFYECKEKTLNSSGKEIHHNKCLVCLTLLVTGDKESQNWTVYFKIIWFK